MGRPGLGKGEAANPALALLNEAGTANILSDRVTIEFCLEKLSKGFTSAHVTQQGVAFGTDATAIVFSPELSIFITASLSTLPVLADLWDAREGTFTYGTRSKGELKIKSPCMSMLGASTQEWLTASIPTNAVGGGFTRRVNFVYGKERSKDLPWPTHPNGVDTKAKLINDLRHITTLRGEVTFDKDAKHQFELFHTLCKPNEFDDEATAVYTNSMPYHVLKLCMILSVCENDTLVVTEQQVMRACAYVQECRKDIARVFRAVGDSDFASAMDRVLRFVETKGYASFGDILHANYRHVSKPELELVLITLRDGNILREENQGGKVFYTPAITP